MTNRIVFLLLLICSPCLAQNNSQITMDFQRACELYNPLNWPKTAGDNAQVIKVIKRRLLTEVKSSEVQRLFDGASSSSFESYYQNVKKQAQHLLGHQWQCEYFDDYFHPALTLTRVNMGKTEPVRVNPYDPDTLFIELISDQVALFNGAQLSRFNKANLSKAFQLRMKGGKKSIIVSIGKQVSFEKVETLLGLIQKTNQPFVLVTPEN